MATGVPTIKELVLEAEENFETGRHGNSENLFKNAAIRTLEKNIVPDGLYLSYRSLYDAEKSGKSVLDQLKFINHIQQLLLKYIITQGTRSLGTDEYDPQFRVQVLELIQQAMRSLGMGEERQSILQTLINEYQTLFDETEDKRYLVSIVELVDDHDWTLKLLETTYTESKQQADEGQFDGDLVAAALIIQILKYIPVSDQQPETSQFNNILQKYSTLLNQIIAGEYYGTSREEDVMHYIKRYDQQWFVSWLR